MKKEILEKAWQRNRVNLQGKKIHIDYAEGLRKPRDYTEGKKQKISESIPGKAAGAFFHMDRLKQLQ